MGLFSSLNYKDFLQSKIQEHKDEYGYKSKLAEAAGCQKSFLSQVLNSHVHLTPEHALGLAQFWSLLQREREYFLELVNYARAGTPELSHYLRDKLKRLKSDHEHLGKRFEQPTLHVSEDSAALYYSSWHYSAIHILITIPQFRTVPKIARRLEVSESVVLAVLKQLETLELVERSGDAWSATKKSVHLSKDSVFNMINNGNWRQKAQTESQQRNNQSIHYTGVYSMSLSDMETLRDMTFEFLDQTRNVVTRSKEEDLICFTCDLFRV